jgi:hypothetical protein
VKRVQERLATYGTWDHVSLSESALGTGQWLFRIQHGTHSFVFAVPVGPESESRVDQEVDLAVAQLGTRENGS